MSETGSAAARLIRESVGAEKVQATLDERGYGSVLTRNKWADGQLLVFMYAKNQAALVENIQKNYPSIVSRIRERELTRIEATTYAVNGTNKGLQERVQDVMQVDMRIPAGFVEALYEEKDKVMWLRRETDKASYNVLLQRLPYRASEQFSRDTFLRVQNELGRRYISTTVANTYMRVNDVDLPLYTKIMDINGKYALEARGIWDIVNDFMGGPFITYLILDEARNEVLVANAFIHAPGEKKRDLQQSMEIMLQSIKL